RHLDD
ncbi:alcohol dehydrogenase GroES-like domain protein, partial [Vibrio parahaemolyticus V-223/04]